MSKTLEATQALNPPRVHKKKIKIIKSNCCDFPHSELINNLCVISQPFLH